MLALESGIHLKLAIPCMVGILLMPKVATCKSAKGSPALGEGACHRAARKTGSLTHWLVPALLMPH